MHQRRASIVVVEARRTFPAAYLVALVCGEYFMSGFGDLLKHAREAQGATLETVAAATRIAPRHLEALERSDHGSLPAAPFAKGYIRAYAQHLGVDPEPILEAYRAEERERGLDSPDAEHRMLEELSRLVAQRSESPSRASRRLLASLGAVLGLVAAVVAAGALWLQKQVPAPAPAVATPVASPSDRVASHETPTSDPPRGEPLPAGKARPPAPRQRADASRAALSVADFGVGAKVNNRRLVGRADRFAEGSQVAFWTRVTGGQAGDVIRHVWFHEGEAVMRAHLEIGGADWRTFSRRVLPEGATGDWVVEARGPDGGLLARLEFLCVPDDS
jgi:cytoskeletal protein RodZ